MFVHEPAARQGEGGFHEEWRRRRFEEDGGGFEEDGGDSDVRRMEARSHPGVARAWRSRGWWNPMGAGMATFGAWLTGAGEPVPEGRRGRRRGRRFFPSPHAPLPRILYFVSFCGRWVGTFTGVYCVVAVAGGCHPVPHLYLSTVGSPLALSIALVLISGSCLIPLRLVFISS